MTGSRTAAEDEDELGRWLRDVASRLRTLDPDDEDDSDLLPVLDIVGDARLVAIGESMHRVHEFLQLRDRLFRVLVRHAGFTALVLESGTPETRTADAWIRRTEAGGPRVREVLRTGITYGFGACQETLDLLTWMRERNVTGRGTVRLYGMDLPDSSASALPGVLAALDVLDAANPEYARRARETLLPRFGYLPEDRTGLAQAAPSIQSYLSLDPADRAALTEGIDDLAWRLRALRPSAISALGGDDDARERVEAALDDVGAAQAADAFLRAMTQAATRTWPPANIRDAWMADAVDRVLDREPRIVVAAAGGHVQRTPFSAPPFVPEPMTTLGGHLMERHGDDYVVIGTAFGGGEQWLHRPRPDDPPGRSRPFVAPLAPSAEGSVDAAIARSGIGDALIDLRTTTPAVSAALDDLSGSLNGDVLQPLPVRAAYDAIVYVDRVSPWHTWVDDRGIA